MTQRTFLASKIHGVVVTGTALTYTESVTIGIDLMNAAGIEPFEQVQVVNLATGARWQTYAIPGTPGVFSIGGGASRLAAVGDRCSVLTYVQAESFGGAPLVICNTDNSFTGDHYLPFTLSPQTPDQAATPAAPVPTPEQSAPAEPEPEAVPVPPQQAPVVPVQPSEFNPFAPGGQVRGQVGDLVVLDDPQPDVPAARQPVTDFAGGSGWSAVPGQADGPAGLSASPHDAYAPLSDGQPVRA